MARERITELKDYNSFLKNDIAELKESQSLLKEVIKSLKKGALPPQTGT
jgi:hypothetical protein